MHESLRSFCIGCGSKVPNLDGHQGDRHANSVANHRIPADHGGIQGPCRDVGVGAIAPGFAMLKKASALHTLIRQRHPTPSCGGHAPTAERTMIPARMCLESFDRRPGIREPSNSRRPRRDPRSLPGRWRWCDRPWLCDAQKASALHTLIRQRHPTPSCGGHAPTQRKDMIPARMCLESLTAGPRN